MEAPNKKQSVAEKGKIFEELQDLISDQLKAVTYKWLARHFSLPANHAKRLLFEFAEKYRNKVASTYLVAGWTKGADPHHVVQLVDASEVADRRTKLEPVTSLHVYSIQPTPPKGSSNILNYDELQTRELFLGMVKQGDLNCLSDNRWSAVQCQVAKRDPSLASKKPVPAPPAEEKPVSAVAKAVTDAAAGKPAAAAAAAVKEEKEPEAKSASAPAQAAEAVPAVKPAAAKGKGSAIASMWSKAPAKKGARKPAPQQAAAQPSLRAKATAVDAEAFMRLNQQEAASSSGEDNEEDIPIRRSQAPRKSALADSDDEAEVVPAQKPAAPAAEPEAASRRPAKRNTVLDEASDSEDEWDAPKQAAGKGRPGITAPLAADATVHVTASKPAPAEAALRADADEAMEGGAAAEEEAGPRAKQGRKPREASAGAKRGAPGTVKLHDSMSGPAQKKVQRTTYNEKGEEVTEMVYEDAAPELAAAPVDDKVAEPAPEEKPKQDAEELVAATSRSNNSGGVKRKAGGGVDSKAAKKPAGKGKAGLAAGQRNIASFFAKR